MHGTDDHSDEDGEDVDRPSAWPVRPASGDDLGDSFSLEEEPKNKRGWVDEILSRKDGEDTEDEDEDSSEESDSAEGDGDEEGSGEDEMEHGKTYSLKDWEQSEDELDLNDEEDEEEDEEEEDEDDDDEEKNDVDGERRQMEPNDGITNSRVGDETKKDITKSSEGTRVKVDNKQVLNQGKSLPCLIEAPKSLDELNILFDGCSNSEIVILISRVRASNAIALAAENRKKIQVWNSNILIISV